MRQLSRRQWLGYGCAACAVGHPFSTLHAQTAPPLPGPLAKPDLSSDEGGLWASMDREETKLRRSEFRIKDPSLTNYLNGLVCRLAGDHCSSLRVYAVKSPMFNATAAPNGMLQVYSGMLLRVENEAQLAAVLGHEMGHYMMRHSLKILRDASSKAAFATLLSAFGAVGGLGTLLVAGSIYQFSRDQESEADLIGLYLANRAGYDPSEAAVIWANLRAELSQGAGGDPAKKSIFFASHPNIGDRESVIRKWSQGKSGVTNTAEWDKVIEPHLWQLLEDELRRAQYDESLVMLGRQITRRPDRADLVYFKGEAYRLRGKAGDIENAHKQYQHALSLHQPPPVIYRAQGNLFKSQGIKDKALAAYQSYLQASPDAIDASLVQNYISELQS